MNDKETIYICALRYALGRRTYITGIVSDFIREQELSEECKAVMIKDIEKCDDYGHEIDKYHWLKLLKHLNATKRKG